jgi:glycine/sarcosine N-methyltransferase
MASTDTEQDRFYSSIAKYYAMIFPFNPAQLSFVEKETGPVKGKYYLDAGCGSGELAYALADKGAEVTAIDLNRVLLAQAMEKRSHAGIVYRNADMLDIAEFCEPSFFDGVICFGNTLVHLGGSEDIKKFFKAIRKVLKPSGCFMLQILNYDYIFQQKIESLPTIENESVRFERRYRFIPGSRNLRFSTELTLKASGEVIENETGLLGIGLNDLESLLSQAGFNNIRCYADFLMTPQGDAHLPLVVTAHNL